ncbi:MAG: methyltransferase domain-containing protein [Anaerolineales bacterium]|nr:methyltransferase domain-containing protein [Anaerolineales bacterium]
MTNTASYIRSMVLSQPLIKPAIQSAIQALHLPLGSKGLDAGCGIGLQSLLLADAVGSNGHITGIDIAPEFLDYGQNLIREAGVSKQITFQKGDVTALPFENGYFDWVWSSFLVGYTPSIEPLPAIRELARVVKPGGDVAILVWSSEKILPGYPVMESHLNATSSGIAPFTKNTKPENHFLRALGWFHQTGLVNIRAQTFACDAYAPLNDDLRNAMIALFEMRWSGIESEVCIEDWVEYQRLCTPTSPEFLLNTPDYYAFFTLTMFHGKVAN